MKTKGLTLFEVLRSNPEEDGHNENGIIFNVGLTFRCPEWDNEDSACLTPWQYKFPSGKVEETLEIAKNGAILLSHEVVALLLRNDLELY